VLPFARRGFGSGAGEELEIFYYGILTFMVLVFVLAPVVLIAGPFLVAAASSIRVVISESGLRVRRRLIITLRDQVVPRTKISDVQLWRYAGRTAGILITGPSVKMKLSAKLPEAELTELCARVRARLGLDEPMGTGRP